MSPIISFHFSLPFPRVIDLSSLLGRRGKEKVRKDHDKGSMFYYLVSILHHLLSLLFPSLYSLPVFLLVRLSHVTVLCSAFGTV